MPPGDLLSWKAPTFGAAISSRRSCGRMVRHCNLTACGIFFRRRAESFSRLESPTKSTVSLASLLRTHKSRRKYQERTHLVRRLRRVVQARACARHIGECDERL